MSVEIRLDETINNVAVGTLTDFHWIRRDGVVMDKFNPIFRAKPNPNDEFLNVSEDKYEYLMGKYNPVIDESTTTQKHRPGQHDQYRHAGTKSYSSIDDLVKDGVGLMESHDEIYDNSKSQAENGNVGMRILLERMGKGGKPEKVASIEDLDGDPIYRGTSQTNIDSMTNNDYDRIGVGQYGDGYYFSNSVETANTYGDLQGSSVMTAGWKQDAKVAEYTLDVEVLDFRIAQQDAGSNAIEALNINTNASEAQDAVFGLFYESNAESLVTNLILDDFDGFELSMPDGEETFTVVFNREALQVVSE